MGVAESVAQLKGFVAKRRWPEAERVARQILVSEPRNVDANVALAEALLAARKHADARRPLAVALEEAPGRGDVVLALGRAHELAGEPAIALEKYAIAAALSPADPMPHFRTGVVLGAQGRLDAAMAAYRRAIACAPEHPEALTNLADALKRKGRTLESVPLFERALRANPRLPEAHYGLAGAVADTDPKRALAHYDRAIEARPGFTKAVERRAALYAVLAAGKRAPAPAAPATAIAPAAPTGKRRIDALVRLGVEHKQAGRHAEAVATYQEILAFDPTNVNALNNAGNALRAMGRTQEAIAMLERAVAVDPGWHPAWYNLGTALRSARQVTRSLEAYERALALDPTHPDTRGAVVSMRLKSCDWRPLEGKPIHDHLPAMFAAAGPNYLLPPFDALTFGAPMADALRIARPWVTRARAHNPPLPPVMPRREGPLRVGYLSSYFRTHAMSCLVGSLFGVHDRRRVQVYAYSYGRDDGSAIRKRLLDQFDVVRDLRSESVADSAERIRADGIDVLVDLNGHADDPRIGIPMRRPAPVQMQWIGYPGSMGDDEGTPRIWDYTLVDRVVVPDEDRRHFSEHVIRLPDCYLIGDHERPIGDAPTRASQGLPNDAFVFGCFNNNYKITPAFLSAWVRVLQQVPGAVLWLLGPRAEVEENLRREVVARGLDPGRLVFAPLVAPALHLARHRLVDLSLDTQPYNAHTTAQDALWAGAPILTLRGDTFVSRVCESVLRAANLPELVADDLAGYEALAVAIARDPARLAALKEKVRDARRAPVFDTARTARSLETAYEMAVAQTLAGTRSHFDVPPAG